MLSFNLSMEYKCKVCHFYKAINKCALSINVRYAFLQTNVRYAFLQTNVVGKLSPCLNKKVK